MEMNELIAERRKLAWREELRKSHSPKERTAIARAQMPELDPHYRITTLTEEVNQGLTEEQALVEARRCLDCAKPTCMEGCPVGIHIPSFIKEIERGILLPQLPRYEKQPVCLPSVVVSALKNANAKAGAYTKQ